MNIFLPITKRDDEQQMVYGYASTPDLDSQGEIVSIEAIQKALPEYLKFPTIREMHDAKAVGVTKEAQIDGKKGLYIGAKVVDKGAWEKVKEGVYRAFSIGGKVTKKIGNEIQDLVLTEISLVDSPANKSAVITLFKMDDNKKKVPEQLKKYMEEYEVAETAVDVEALMQEEIIESSRILSLACELCYTYYFFRDSGRPTEKLQEAITALKYLAIQLLTQEEYNKFDGVLLTINQSTGGSAKHMHDFLKTQTGRSPLLKGVRMSAQIKKTDEAVKVEVEVETPVVEEVKEEAPVAEVEVKTEEEPKVEEKEASEKNETLEKLESLESKLVKKEEKAEKKEVEKAEESSDLLAKVEAQNESLAKTTKQVDQLFQIVAKMSSVLGEVVGRVTAVEATPASPKTVATYAVEKAVSTNKGDETPGNKRVQEIQSRLGELTTMRETNLSKYQADGQVEAFALMDELQKLLK